MNSAFSVCVLIVFKILTAFLLVKKMQYIKLLLAYMHLRTNLKSFQQPFLEALWIVWRNFFFLQRVVGAQNTRKSTNDRMRSSRFVDEVYMYSIADFGNEI